MGSKAFEFVGKAPAAERSLGSKSEIQGKRRGAVNAGPWAAREIAILQGRPGTLKEVWKRHHRPPPLYN